MVAFGEEYSHYYDLLYEDKDYAKEVRYLRNLFDRFSSIPVRRIIDVACGTGNHAIPLAKQGFAVCGIDISPHMLKVAKAKAKNSAISRNISFRHGDMRLYRPMGKFDACLCMFAALGYLSNHQQILAALSSMHKHLRPGGLLILDVWNGLAVISVKPSLRTKTVHQNGITVKRQAEPSLDATNSLCTVRYRLAVTSKGRTVNFSEIHRMRYFYPDEMKLLLRISGFKLFSLHPSSQPTRNLTSRDWGMTAVAACVE